MAADPSAIEIAEDSALAAAIQGAAAERRALRVTVGGQIFVLNAQPVTVHEPDVHADAVPSVEDALETLRRLSGIGESAEPTDIGCNKHRSWRTLTSRAAREHVTPQAIP